MCIYLAITLIFTDQCTIFGPFYFNKYAWRKRPPKIPTTQICVAFVLGQKRQKPVANFLICQDGKMATQTPTTQISVAFALRAKATEKPFK